MIMPENITVAECRQVTVRNVGTYFIETQDSEQNKMEK
jgi:hypothetical protein